LKTTLVPIALFLVFVCNVKAVHAQNVLQYNFTVDDGLPSNECYFTHVDQKGYVWVGTDRGLCRYDGYTFEVFTTKNSSLTGNTAFNVYEHNNGDLWFMCFNRTVSIFDLNTEEFRPFSQNEDLQKLKSWTTDIIPFDSSLYLFSNLQYLSFYKYDIAKDSGSISRIKNIVRDSSVLDPSIVLNVSTMKRRLSKVFQIRGTKMAWTNCTHCGPNIDGYMLLRSLIRVDSFQIGGMQNHLFQISDLGEASFLKFQSKIEKVIRASDNRILVVTSDTVFSLLGQKLVPLLVDGGYTGISQGREGNYWVSTIDRGMLMVPRLTLASTRGHMLYEKKVTALERLDQELWVGAYPESIYRLSDRDSTASFVAAIQSGMVSKLEVRSIWKSDKHLLTTGSLSFDLQEEELKPKRFYSKGNTIYNVTCPGGKLVSIGYEPGYFVYDSIDLLENASDSNYTWFDTRGERITHLHKDAAGNIWMASLGGIWKLRCEALDKPQKLDFDDRLNQRFNAVRSQDGFLVLGSAVDGLVILRDSHVSHLTTDSGLISNVVECLAFECDSVCWVGSNKGLSKVSLSHRVSRSKVLYSLGKSDGIYPASINALSVYDGLLWIGTDRGLTTVSLDELIPCTTKPLIYIEQVLATGSEEFGSLQTKFAYDQNNLSVTFVGICQNKPEKGFYRYRLLTDNSDNRAYTVSNNNSASFLDLSPGKYTFEVACRNRNNVWSETKAFQFEIIPHFTDTLWFRITMYLLIALLVAGGFYLRLKEIRRRNERDKQLAELEFKFKESELAILRNQMNPHFMFNALNSIQSYILKSDRDTASHYVQRFSKLMRSSLELSMDDWISLAVEIDFLANYLTMEKMRFPERFTFEIQVDPDLDPHDVLLPPFLIQPIVENSVKHAFKNRETGGVITIAFSLQVGEVLCTVTDNGIGINQENLNKPRASHKSYGIEVVRNRLRLILRDENAEPLRYTDINTIHDNQTGTIVEIRIPIE